MPKLTFVWLVSARAVPGTRGPVEPTALRFGDRTLTYAQLRDAAAAVAERVAGPSGWPCGR